MVVSGAFQNLESEPSDRSSPLAFCMAQQQLYDDLLEAVRKYPPLQALAEFEDTFFGYTHTADTDVSPFIYKILFADDEAEFCNTIKRACYIFVNNWDLARQGEMVHELLALFKHPSLEKSTPLPSLKRLRQWLRDFAKSSDFEELELFAIQRVGPIPPGNWSTRYAAYQLTAQSVNERNSERRLVPCHGGSKTSSNTTWRCTLPFHKTLHGLIKNT